VHAVNICVLDNTTPSNLINLSVLKNAKITLYCRIYIAYTFSKFSPGWCSWHPQREWTTPSRTYPEQKAVCGTLTTPTPISA